MKVNLKYWRMRKALTMRDLVAISGVSTQTIVNIERYGHMPQPSVIKKLSAALGVSIEDLIQDDEPEGKLNPAKAA
jgi:transcriptional regulator with XRE-family HTH domain